jgi:peptidoglycan hydrolase FlgJ
VTAVSRPGRCRCRARGRPRLAVPEGAAPIGGLKPGRLRDPVAVPPAAPSAQAGRVEADFRPETPEAFVAQLWPHAQRAARRLGVPAEVLVAQAALETGWGRHMIRDASGGPSFNLFGVKAAGDWQGRQASVSTLEFINGVPERRREPFRVYSGLGESFADYVRLIESRPRYAEARAATTAAEYARQLQAAGYATDPDYATKIIAIVERGLPGRPAAVADVPRDQVHTRAADIQTSGLAAPARAVAGDEA